MHNLLTILFVTMVVWGFRAGPIFNSKAWNWEKGKPTLVFFLSMLSAGIGLVGLICLFSVDTRNL